MISDLDLNNIIYEVTRVLPFKTYRKLRRNGKIIKYLYYGNLDFFYVPGASLALHGLHCLFSKRGRL